MFTHPKSISSDLVRDLDEQLTRLDAVAHVSVDHAELVLVAIRTDFAAPVPLDHPPIGSFVEAELIAARLNALQGVGDRGRMAILQRMASAGGH